MADQIMYNSIVRTVHPLSAGMSSVSADESPQDVRSALFSELKEKRLLPRSRHSYAVR